MSTGAVPPECGPHPSCPITIAPLGCGGELVASTPYGGVRTGAVSATIGGTPQYITYIYASMTGLAQSSAHTASDHATHPHGRVSCALWASLAQLPRALPAS